MSLQEVRNVPESLHSGVPHRSILDNPLALNSFQRRMRKMVYGHRGGPRGERDRKPKAAYKDNIERVCARCGHESESEVVRITTKYYCFRGEECSERLKKNGNGTSRGVSSRKKKDSQ
jgi:ribosomal protein L44E